jgi:phosphatidylglycerol lysyltransferase
MTSPSLETRRALLRQFGAFTLAYSATHQPGLQYFGDERGFLAYKRVGRTVFVLSDPIAPPGRHAGLIDEFRALNDDICFVQISRPVALLLAGRGYMVNEMGVETRLDLASYTFNGKDKRNLRMATNRMQKRGFVTRECSMAELDRAEVEALSSAWRQTRTIKHREVGFLNRPMVLDDEPDVRRFFTFAADGRLMALGFFDPIYENGAVIGYSTSFKRRLPESDLKSGQAIIRMAIEQFQREGRKHVFLGLSPMAGIEDAEFRCNRLVSMWFRFSYGNGLFNRFVYNLRGHADHKREFRGISERTYYASDKSLALPRLLKLMAACNLFSWPSLGRRGASGRDLPQDAVGAS